MNPDKLITFEGYKLLSGAYSLFMVIEAKSFDDAAKKMANAVGNEQRFLVRNVPKVGQSPLILAYVAEVGARKATV